VEVVVDVGGIFGRRHVRLFDADVIQAVPLEDDLAGLDVELLGDPVPRCAVLHAAGRRQIRRHRRVGRQQRSVLGRDEELVQVPPVAVARPDSRNLAVSIVEDDVLADAVPGDDAALPPGKHGPPPVALHLEVPRGDVLFEPHELTAVVEDHGSVLTGTFLQGHKDVARGCA
jgi:hypothetical protein